VNVNVNAGNLAVFSPSAVPVAADAEEEKVDSPAVNIIPIGTGGEATRIRYKVISGNIGDFTGSFTKEQVKLYPY
jgi:hypothetical protein